MSEWITVVEMSEKTNIRQETLKRYMSMHKHLLRMKKEHGTYQLHEDCYDVLTKIRELYKQGKTNKDVDKLLTSSGIPMTIDVVSESGEIVSADMSEVVSNIKAALEEQKQASAKQKDFNEILLNLLETQSEKFDARRKYIKDSVNRRDEQLMASLRASQEAKKSLLSTQTSEKEEKKKSWFKRIFK
ncbi:DUF3967 domain-containing protein [Domibacillus aminovorans]|uniref:HTH merR-type domain-containing protein n=1 Tax=Domibacillus aminovorans TaxID=29332 RepID=A0A177L4F7_9BACI|nr:DUF3967 domain-containing protein [Domibacillus aminovorans]OAH60217.1 hypothetical protein AWH49_17270 [Domibacillus aminovorans]